MPNRKLYLSLFLALLFVIIFLVKDRFQMGLYQDEFHYLPTAVLFSTEPIPSHQLLTTYNELNTPIPFILGGWVLRAFGENIQYLRLLTFVTSFLLLMIFVWNSPEKSKRLWLCLAGLIAFPNYYLVSVYYYTDIFAMIFVLAGVVAYIKKVHWLGMLMLIGGVCCRQYMLAFPAAIVAFEILDNFSKAGNFKAFQARLFSNYTWLYYSVSVLSIVPWVLLWHGPAPAPVMAEQHYNSDKLVQYNFGFMLYASAVVAGYYVIPEMIFTGKLKYYLTYPKRHAKQLIAFLLFVGILAAFFPAKQAYNPYFTWPYLGYLDQLLVTVGVAGFIKQIIFALLMLLTLMLFLTTPLNLASWMVIINTVLLGKAQLSWDKYSLPLIMALWFLAMFDAQWSLNAHKEHPDLLAK